ncbi:hypothetical protein [Pseudomonas veronii]|uniref:Uncharacterized protein n=1 Tax=Pseudomonas veronii TaxID=76761 RepID=A0A4P7YA01_PSEVE|nr:hypothetical protein [Pseudomonas veronii]QCG68164.1 hypothetical protein E4167_29855 [Pseudomonas veronii]
MDEEIGNYPHAKLFYRPEEIAFRWCHLMALEQQILRDVRHLQGFPNRKFKQWPCLDQKLEILWDAIRNNELLYGSLGITVKSDETVDPRYLTIRHTDLKQWFNQYHPLDKPEFLFTYIERQTTSALTIDIYQALLIELEALKAQRDRNQLLLEELKTEREKLQQENIALLSRLRTTSPPSERSEKAYYALLAHSLTSCWDTRLEVTPIPPSRAKHRSSLSFWPTMQESMASRSEPWRISSQRPNAASPDQNETENCERCCRILRCETVPDPF